MTDRVEELARAIAAVSRPQPVECPDLPGLTGYAAWLANALLARERGLRAESRGTAQPEQRSVPMADRPSGSAINSSLPATAARSAPESTSEHHATVQRVSPDTNLNPLAAPFLPGGILRSAAPRAPKAMPPRPITSAKRPHLVYTEINHMRSPTMHPPDVVIPRLRDLPPEYVQQDGSLTLHLQWVIAQVGYAHFQAGVSGRAELVPNSWIRNEGWRYGLPKGVIRWLAGGFQGGIFRVSR